MKTYHNEASTGGITKIALKKFLDFFGQSRDSQNCKMTFKVQVALQGLKISLAKVDLQVPQFLMISYLYGTNSEVFIFYCIVFFKSN